MSANSSWDSALPMRLLFESCAYAVVVVKETHQVRLDVEPERSAGVAPRGFNPPASGMRKNEYGPPFITRTIPGRASVFSGPGLRE